MSEKTKKLSQEEMDKLEARASEIVNELAEIYHTLPNNTDYCVMVLRGNLSDENKQVSTIVGSVMELAGCIASERANGETGMAFKLADLLVENKGSSMPLLEILKAKFDLERDNKEEVKSEG